MNKKQLSERDIITQFIVPSIKKAGWSIEKQLREEVGFTAGRIKVRGTKVKRGERKRADIILYYRPNIPVAIIEAKDNTHSTGSGLQQGFHLHRSGKRQKVSTAPSFRHMFSGCRSTGRS